MLTKLLEADTKVLFIPWTEDKKTAKAFKL
jgi:hypothetical protein